MASEFVKTETKHAVEELHQHSSVNHHDDDHGHQDHDDEHDHAAGWHDFARIAFVGVAVLAVWFRVWEPFRDSERHWPRRDAYWRLAHLQRSV